MPTPSVYNRVAAERDVLEKGMTELRELVHRLGAGAVYVYDGLQDDGDRTYLGSSNHADVLLKMKELYDEYRAVTGDMGSEVEIPG